MPASLNATLCDTEREFASLASEWDDLLARSPSSSVFLTWGWLHAWWTHLRGGRELAIVLVREPGGRLVGAAPFCIGRPGRGSPFRVLHFLGTERVSSDYLDIVAEPGAEESVAGAVWQVLLARGPKWDWLCLSDLLPSSLVSRVFLKHDAASGLLRNEVHGQVCPYLPLAATREGFRRSLGSSMRVNLRKKIQRLEEGGVRFGFLETPRELMPALETFFELHEQRWRSRNQAGNFWDPRVRRFHEDVVATMSPLGQMRLYFLWHRERAVASLYALQYKGTLFCYQTGFDPTPPDASIRVTKYSPGLVVIGRSMEDAIDRSLGEFDFLRGPEDYKFEWTSASRTTDTVELARRDAPGGVLHLFGQRLTTALKRPIRQLLGRAQPVRGPAA